MKNKVALSSPALVAVVGVGLLSLFPLTLQPSSLSSLISYSIYFVWVTLAVSWNLVGGYAKLLNLGLVAFFALGCIVGGEALASGLSFAESIALSGLAGAFLGLILIPAFRVRAFYFAIATLFIPLIIKPLVELLAGVANFEVPQNAVLGPAALYYLGLGMTGLAILGSSLLMRSKVGYALRAVGADETASSSVGVEATSFKAIALMVSGSLASVAGFYYLQMIGTVNTTLFAGLNFSLFPIFMVIIGGSGTDEGPVAGALIFSAVNYGVTAFLPNSTVDTLILSAMIVATAVLLPKGIVPGVRAHLSKARRFRTGRPESNGKRQGDSSVHAPVRILRTRLTRE